MEPTTSTPQRTIRKLAQHQRFIVRHQHDIDDGWEALAFIQRTINTLSQRVRELEKTLADRTADS